METTTNHNNRQATKAISGMYLVQHSAASRLLAEQLGEYRFFHSNQWLLLSLWVDRHWGLRQKPLAPNWNLSILLLSLHQNRGFAIYLAIAMANLSIKDPGGGGAIWFSSTISGWIQTQPQEFLLSEFKVGFKYCWSCFLEQGPGHYFPDCLRSTKWAVYHVCTLEGIKVSPMTITGVVRKNRAVHSTSPHVFSYLTLQFQFWLYKVTRQMAAQTKDVTFVWKGL